MYCAGCKTLNAARTRTGYSPDGKKWEYCDVCGGMAPVWLPDVFLGNGKGIKADENLCGDDGEPIPYQTKREKAVIMKMRGLRQADSAEHQHGSRNETKRRTYFI